MLAVILALEAFFLGVACTLWMASYTETVEARNPAVTATGLAIWGWIVRVVVFIAFLIIPVMINSVTPLVDYGSTVSAYATKYSSELAFAQSHSAVVATAQTYQAQLAWAPAISSGDLIQGLQQPEPAGKAEDGRVRLVLALAGIGDDRKPSAGRIEPFHDDADLRLAHRGWPGPVATSASWRIPRQSPGLTLPCKLPYVCAAKSRGARTDDVAESAGDWVAEGTGDGNGDSEVRND
jgi:hypothetical protein